MSRRNTGEEVKQQDRHLLNYLLELIQDSKEYGIKYNKTLHYTFPTTEAILMGTIYTSWKIQKPYTHTYTQVSLL
jgi:hypothetical protein